MNTHGNFASGIVVMTAVALILMMDSVAVLVHWPGGDGKFVF